VGDSYGRGWSCMREIDRKQNKSFFSLTSGICV
jgi:hypothetical protein